MSLHFNLVPVLNTENTNVGIFKFWQKNFVHVVWVERVGTENAGNDMILPGAPGKCEKHQARWNREKRKLNKQDTGD